MNNNLPIGSVIKTLKNEIKVIIGYVKEDNVLKYSTVNYPFGLLSFDKVDIINYSDVSSVIFEGFKNNKYEQFNKYLNNEIKNYDIFE